MIEVEILGCVVTAQYGTLKAGDILRTSEAFAAHLVNDCGAAKYAQAVEVVEPVEPEPEVVEVAEPEPKPRKQKS